MGYVLKKFKGNEQIQYGILVVTALRAGYI
jgi:hypothetical protein